MLPANQRHQIEQCSNLAKNMSIFNVAKIFPKKISNETPY
jgi:hypothetical protein